MEGVGSDLIGRRVNVDVSPLLLQPCGESGEERCSICNIDNSRFEYRCLVWCLSGWL